MMKGIGLVIALIMMPALAPCQRGAVADSLVLERTRCYGTCPAYRLSLTADGRVAFESRDPGDSTRAADRVSAGTLQDLLDRATSLQFHSLPDTIANSTTLCADHATDHPTAIVTIYAGPGRKSVTDYHGCFASREHGVTPVIARLRAFEAAIDSAVNSARWVRPAQRRP